MTDKPLENKDNPNKNTTPDLRKTPVFCSDFYSQYKVEKLRNDYLEEENQGLKRRITGLELELKLLKEEKENDA